MEILEISADQGLDVKLQTMCHLAVQTGYCFDVAGIFTKCIKKLLSLFSRCDFSGRWWQSAPPKKHSPLHKINSSHQFLQKLWPGPYFIDPRLVLCLFLTSLCFHVFWATTDMHSHRWACVALYPKGCFPRILGKIASFRDQTKSTSSFVRGKIIPPIFCWLYDDGHVYSSSSSERKYFKKYFKN